ncbi:hypothetical protein KVK74_03015 [Helicobacter pylori]|nr:hypothetical protein KVK74_03015 [Helicobacter pylori]
MPNKAKVVPKWLFKTIGCGFKVLLEVLWIKVSQTHKKIGGFATPPPNNAV